MGRESGRALGRLRRVGRPRGRLAFEQLERRGLLAAVVPQFTVNQSPRLQPGDAPLAGYPGGDTDRVDLLWQTVPAGAGTLDSFHVAYRGAGSQDAWRPVPLGTPVDTGVDGRLIHSASITGLGWNSSYEYRVQQLRGGEVVAEYGHEFRTRLRAGDDTPFSFVAYGDSASPTVAGFRSVQGRINQMNPAFAVLLGDNVYDAGTHAESDARFDPRINPEAAAWMAGHVDYLGLGNHDVATGGGLPAEQNYSTPVPRAGVTAPVAPPAGERPEHDYSWDYGGVHFVTFDTNSLATPARLDGLLDWVEADLAASTARWKIVYGHHPLAGVPDKPESPAGDYYQQVVNRLKAAGVDLLMTGHSHTYGWTYPLRGQIEGVATFANHGTDDRFLAGEGLTQLVSGVGGQGVRAGDFGLFPFVATGFTASSAVPARLGFAKIDVTPGSLTVSYVAADDGQVIDSFRIDKESVQEVSFQQGVGGYAGAIDTWLGEAAAAVTMTRSPALKVDADNPGGTWLKAQALLRFDGLFGPGQGQIPANAVFRSATLRLNVQNPGDTINVHRMAADWSDGDTWNSRIGGIQADGAEAVAFADTSTGRSRIGTLAFDVLGSLRAWQTNPSANRGWALLPTGPDGVDFDSTEGTVPPRLTVTFVCTASDPGPRPQVLVADRLGRTTAGYAGDGMPLGQATIANQPRGIATSPDGARIWTITTAGQVNVQDTVFNRIGSWIAGGVQMATGIAVSGRDIYLSDAGLRRVLVYANAVGRLAGTQLPDRSFPLAADNTDVRDLATNGNFVWTVQAGPVPMVFVCRATTGRLVGSWLLAAGNTAPTGIAIDVSGKSRSIWVVDAGTRRVYEYALARPLRQGRGVVAASFALAAAGTNPNGIAVSLDGLPRPGVQAVAS